MAIGATPPLCCTPELEESCKGVQHEGGAAIRCLQSAQGSPTFTAACRTEVSVYEARISSDVRWASPRRHAMLTGADFGVGVEGGPCHAVDVDVDVDVQNDGT